MNVFRFLYYLFKKHPKRLPVVIIVLIFSGLLESIGIGAVIPIFEFFFQNRTYETDNIISNTIFSILNFLHLPVSLPGLFSLIIGLFCIKSCISFFQNWLLASISTAAFKRISYDFMNSIFACNWITFQKEKQGELLNLFSVEMEKINHCINSCINFFSELALLLFYLTLSCLISVKITLISIGLLFITIIPLKQLNKYVRRISGLLVDSRNNHTSNLQELLTAFKWIQSSSNHKLALEKFNKTLPDVKNFQFKAHIYVSILPSFFIVFSIISLSVIAYISLVIFKLSFANFLLITVIFYRIYPKFQYLQSFYQSFQAYSPSKDNILKKLNYFSKNKYKCGGIEVSNISTIEFSNVSFSYENSNIINTLNISINKNEFIGMIGPSGCGKSTFIDLLTGLLRSQEGDVLINSTSINHINMSSYNSKIGLVSQDIILFHASIKDNLTWGLKSVTQDDINDACKKAHCLEFIEPLADKFDTIIGDRGVKLSGGQKQRLALARELLRKPQLLILDEATSALDAQSEHYIHDSIGKLKGELTLIVISHRLATIKQADRILVLDKGSIIDDGPWKELSSKKGLFSHFKGLQLLDS